MKKYMHLLNGRPALFEDQIVFAGKNGMRLSKMADSLVQIKKEQRLSRVYRSSRGWDDDGIFVYDYVLIKE